MWERWWRPIPLWQIVCFLIYVLFGIAKFFSMEFAFFMLFASVRQSAPTNPLTHAPAPTPATARAPAHTRTHPHATARPQPCTCAPRAQESLIDIESMKVRCAWVVLHKRLLLLLCTCFFGYLLPITRQPRFLLPPPSLATPLEEKTTCRTCSPCH